MPLDLIPGSWYGLRVRARYESRVAELLSLKGYETFVPTFCERRRWTDRIKNVATPMFPSYVFLRAGERVTGQVLTTPGVMHFVGFGKTPAPIEEREMAAVQRIAAAGATGRPWPRLKVGQLVEIISGPLAGLEGFLLEEKGDRRFVVSVSMLQRSIAVDLSEDWMAASDKARATDRSAKPGSLAAAPIRL